jgi:hypothetical protein
MTDLVKDPAERGGSASGKATPNPAGLYGTMEPRYLRNVACPTPNLGSGAHAAGISEAKGAQPSGCFGSTPSGRAWGA